MYAAALKCITKIHSRFLLTQRIQNRIESLEGYKVELKLSVYFVTFLAHEVYGGVEV